MEKKPYVNEMKVDTKKVKKKKKKVKKKNFMQCLSELLSQFTTIPKKMIQQWRNDRKGLDNEKVQIIIKQCQKSHKIIICITIITFRKALGLFNL